MESPRKKLRTSKLNILDLYDDLLLEISSRCASSSLTCVRNLRLVCWKFKTLCDDNFVLRSISMEDESFSPHWGDPMRTHIRYNKLRLIGNPNILYRLGISAYFYENRIDEGLSFFRDAYEGGSLEARHIYATILICMGEETKHLGFDLLSYFLLPLMSSTMRRLNRIRSKETPYLSRSPASMVISELERTHVREICNCDGSTTRFLYRSIYWFNYGESEDISSSSICRQCFWNYEVYKTLRVEYD